MHCAPHGKVCSKLAQIGPNWAETVGWACTWDYKNSSHPRLDNPAVTLIVKQWIFVKWLRNWWAITWKRVSRKVKNSWMWSVEYEPQPTMLWLMLFSKWAFPSLWLVWERLFKRAKYIGTTDRMARLLDEKLEMLVMAIYRRWGVEHWRWEYFVWKSYDHDAHRICPGRQLEFFLYKREKIERFVDSVQHLQAADKLPLLDAQYWALLEEHNSIIQLFFPVNLLVTVEDKPTLAPLLVCVAMLTRLLPVGPNSDLVLSRMARRARSAEDACTDEIIWTKKDARVGSFTRWIVLEMNWFTSCIVDDQLQRSTIRGNSRAR